MTLSVHASQISADTLAERFLSALKRGAESLAKQL
jgi:hypothetical protein